MFKGYLLWSMVSLSIYGKVKEVLFGLEFLSIYGEVMKVHLNLAFICGPRVWRNNFLEECWNRGSKGINRMWCSKDMLKQGMMRKGLWFRSWGNKVVHHHYRYIMRVEDLRWGWFQVDLYVYYWATRWGKDKGVGASFYLVLENPGSWCFYLVGVGKAKGL